MNKQGLVAANEVAGDSYFLRSIVVTPEWIYSARNSNSVLTISRRAINRKRYSWLRTRPFYFTMKVKNLSVEITAPNLLLNAKKTTNFAFFSIPVGYKAKSYVICCFYFNIWSLHWSFGLAGGSFSLGGRGGVGRKALYSFHTISDWNSSAGELLGQTPRENMRFFSLQQRFKWKVFPLFTIFHNTKTKQLSLLMEEVNLQQRVYRLPRGRTSGPEAAAHHGSSCSLAVPTMVVPRTWHRSSLSMAHTPLCSMHGGMGSIIKPFLL